MRVARRCPRVAGRPRRRPGHAGACSAALAAQLTPRTSGTRSSPAASRSRRPTGVVLHRHPLRGPAAVRRGGAHGPPAPRPARAAAPTSSWIPAPAPVASRPRALRADRPRPLLRGPPARLHALRAALAPARARPARSRAAPARRDRGLGGDRRRHGGALGRRRRTRRARRASTRSAGAVPPATGPRPYFLRRRRARAAQGARRCSPTRTRAPARAGCEAELWFAGDGPRAPVAGRRRAHARLAPRDESSARCTPARWRS